MAGAPSGVRSARTEPRASVDPINDPGIDGGTSAISQWGGMPSARRFVTGAAPLPTYVARRHATLEVSEKLFPIGQRRRPNEHADRGRFANPDVNSHL
jgi:hypothetical protein